MDADVIVIGLGAFGSAAAAHLARLGARTIGIDAFEPPHAMGSSHGGSRITRLAIGEGDAYVPLVRRSHELWAELAARTGLALHVTTGGLIMGPGDGRSETHGRRDFVGSTIEVARRHGIAHEVLDAEAIAARFPQLLLRGDERSYYEPEAGYLVPEACVAAQLALAREHGATLLTGAPATDLAIDAGGVRLRCGGRNLRAPRAVITAGAWIPSLLGGRYTAELRVYRQVAHWFEPEDPEAWLPGRFPVFIRAHGAGAEEGFYGFPAMPAPAAQPTGAPAPLAVKLAGEQFSTPTTPQAVDRRVDAAERAAFVGRHLNGRLRGVKPAGLRSEACLYTLAPRSDFVIRPHDASPDVVVVSACSGHGFKHSAAVGESIAQTLLGARPHCDLSSFR
jgi:sarcosine oxidase